MRTFLLTILFASAIYADCCPQWLRGPQTSKNIAFSENGIQGTVLVASIHTFTIVSTKHLFFYNA